MEFEGQHIQEDISGEEDLRFHSEPYRRSIFGSELETADIGFDSAIEKESISLASRAGQSKESQQY